MTQNILIFFLEGIKLFVVLWGILRFRRKEKTIASWVVLGASVFCLVIKGIRDPQYTISTFSFMVVVICALQFQEKRRYLLSFLVYLGICSIDELILFVARTLFFSEREELLENAVLSLSINTVSLVLCIAAIVFLRQKDQKGKGKYIHRMEFSYVIVCVVGFLLFTLLMSAVGSFDFGWEETQSEAIIKGIGVLGIMFLIVVVLMIYNLSERKYYRDVVSVNQKLLKTQEQYYEMLLKKDEETRRFRHDIKNHILCLDTLISEENYNEAGEYLKRMKGVMQKADIRVQTGNLLVNAIANDISGKYTDVMFGWDGALPPKMQIPDVDICVIFSNILENAFCAAAACKGDGRVDVSIKELNGGLKILVENNMIGEIQEVEGKIVTKKRDVHNHGWGIVNMCECVEGNGGRAELSFTDSHFVVKIILPNAV